MFHVVFDTTAKVEFHKYMVIGVDAGAIAVTDDRLKVGVFRVVYNLLQELSKIDQTNQYRLFSFSPIPEPILNTFSPHMTNLVLTPVSGWFTWRLPFSLLIHPVDVFLGLSQAIPSGAGKSIGFIYDLGFIHHPEVYPGSAKKLASQTASTAKKSTVIVTISESSKKDIIDHYHVPPEKIVVALPGIDSRFSATGPTFKSPVPYILHVGSLKPGKNIPMLIQGFSQFIRATKSPHLLVLIGGDYWLDQDILTTITACGLDERVRLLGHVPDEILPQYYRGASAFASLSLSEGFCLPVLEAMASGIPVVTSNTGSFPEVVADKSLLCEPNDLGHFAQNLFNVLSNKELRDTVVAKGIAKSQLYSWKKFTEVIYTVMQQLK